MSHADGVNSGVNLLLCRSDEREIANARLCKRFDNAVSREPVR
jgi:hypothetical protein